MRLHAIGALLLIALATVGGKTALACGSGKLIFEDKFLTLNPGLPQQDPRRTNGADGLTYKLTPDDKTRYFLYESDFYKDYEVCGLFTSQVSSSDVHPDSLTDNPAEGIVFWATDENNFYTAVVFPSDGTFAILRSKDGNLLHPVPARAEPAVSKGTSATNEVRVSVQGKTATLFINGKKVLDLPGTPPESGSVFGFFVVADSGTVTVKDIQLREVEGSPQSNQVAEQSPPANSQPAAPVQPPAPAPANSAQPAAPAQPAPASGAQTAAPAQPNSPEPAAPAQPPTPASGQSATPAQPPAAPVSGAQSATPTQPAAPATPSPAAAASQGKPLPPVDGVSVALGDPHERVAQAYPAAINLGGGNLAIADGIKLFFTPKAPVVLSEIMVEDPYKGTIEGIKIGATADDVVAARGKPDDIRPVFGGSGYVYYYAGGNFVRYDVDEKSKKVTDIVQMLVSR